MWFNVISFVFTGKCQNQYPIIAIHCIYADWMSVKKREKKEALITQHWDEHDFDSESNNLCWDKYLGHIYRVSQTEQLLLFFVLIRAQFYNSFCVTALISDRDNEVYILHFVRGFAG